MEKIKANILIVEDSPTDREYYQRILAKNPDYEFKFIEAEMGEEGLDEFKESKPDCILLDYNLPDIDGIEFLSAVQEGTPDHSIPIVVMLTGQGTSAVAVEAMRRGAKDYLVKGAINEQALNQSVSAAIKTGAFKPQLSIPKLTILLIEDNASDRELYKRLLREASHNRFEFLEVETGAEGLTLVQEKCPDCVLLDYNLPDFDGLEFLAEMTTLHKQSNIAMPVVVMLTGQGNESIAVEAMKGGVQDYLVKDEITREVLNRSVTNALETRSLRAHLKDKQKEFELFTYAVSHDLQAPLRRSQQFSQLLISECKDLLSDSGKEYLSYINTNLGRLQQLIKGLLGYYSVEKLTDPLESIDLRDTVEAAISNLDEPISKLSPIINIGELPSVLGHESSLIQLFQNLIQNALKFSCAERVTISIQATQHAGQWEIVVEDNGIGMDKSQQTHIFQAFHRLHGSDEYEGSGLGLAICQKILRYHGGNIWVESEINQGSRFYFTLMKCDL